MDLLFAVYFQAGLLHDESRFTWRSSMNTVQRNAVYCWGLGCFDTQSMRRIVAKPPQWLFFLPMIPLVLFVRPITVKCRFCTVFMVLPFGF